MIRGIPKVDKPLRKRKRAIKKELEKRTVVVWGKIEARKVARGIL